MNTRSYDETHTVTNSTDFLSSGVLFVDFLVLTCYDFQISFLSLWHNINVLFLKARICCPYLGKLDLSPRISLDLAGLSKQPVATAFCLCRWKNRNKFTHLMDPITPRIFISTSSGFDSTQIPVSHLNLSVIFSFSHVVRWLFLSFCILTSSARKKIRVKCYLILFRETWQRKDLIKLTRRGTSHVSHTATAAVLPPIERRLLGCQETTFSVSRCVDEVLQRCNV